MIAQVVVVIPHLAQLSPWIIAVCLLCGIWRTRVYQGKSGYPSRGAKVLLVTLGTAGALISGPELLSLEVFVSMVVLAFAFKLVEMSSRRDAFLVIFLCYFIIAAQFLFAQSLTVALYEIFATVVVTAAMIGLNQMHTDARPLDSARLAATLVLQALPMAVVLFLLFPRLLPLWSMPLPGSGTTGLAEKIAPGDVAALSQSGAPAFRVEFEGASPEYRELYWRAIVYSDFRDGTWSRLPALAERPETVTADTSRQVYYEVLMQPTAQRWLYTLDIPVSQEGTRELSSDYRLESEHPVVSTFRYRVRSALEHQRGATLSAAMRQRETNLPPDDNPRMVAFARELYATAGSVPAFAEALLTHIRNEPFHYTLSPQTLPRQNSVDTFWFDTRRGFCAHYAGAFVYAMRAAEIPARLVGGYLGGEVNDLGGYLMVHQYDAHGWAEVWMEGRGWVRYDPTGAVAPQRIERGPGDALSAEDRSTLSLLAAARLDSGSMAGRILRLLDSVEHQWNLSVVGYDGNIQRRLMTEWFGRMSSTRTGLIMVGLAGACFGFVALLLFWRHGRSKPSPGITLLAPFTRFVSRYGYEPKPEESPQVWLRRVAESVGFESEATVRLAADVETLLYGEGGIQPSVIRQQLRKLQWKVALSFR
jgi:transglutaminase-like putative cysteine protease